MRYGQPENNGNRIWIFVGVIGFVLLILGSSSDDEGAWLCARGSHFCSGIYE